MKRVLVCLNGMSTGDLVNKMNKISIEKNLDLDITGVGYTDIVKEIDGASVILLGPQVKHYIRKVREMAEPKEIPVQIIDHITYGMRNADKVIDLALNIAKK